jgi:hypothetical protein
VSVRKQLDEFNWSQAKIVMKSLVD